MADDLGGRLIRAGLVTQGQLAECLGAAPPHEGALVRGLARSGLSEDGLAGFFVAAGFGPLLEPADLAAADPEAVVLLPAAMARGLLALPVRDSAAGLIVAMAAPSDAHAVAEIARATRSPVLATAARIGDLIEALERAHPGGPPSEERGERESEPPVLELVNVRKKGRLPAPEGYFGSTKGAERVEASATVGPRLVTQESDAFVPLVRTKAVSTRPERATPEPRLDKIITREFESLPREPRLVAVGDPVPAAGEPVSKKPVSKKPVSKKPVSKKPVSKKPPAKKPAWGAGRTLRPPGAALKAKSFAKPEPPSEPEAPASKFERMGLQEDDTEMDLNIVEEPPRSIIPKEHAEWGSLEAPENKINPEKIALLRDSRAPVPVEKMQDIGGTLSAMRASKDRDEVVTLACQGALSVSRAAVLLALRKTVLKGWGGTGAGVSMDAVRNLWIPTSSPSMFRDVVARKEPYLGAPGTAAADGLFRAALGSRGGSVAIHPVLVGSKLVAVFAADDMRFGDEGRERIETLARAISEAFERIIMSGKKSR